MWLKENHKLLSISFKLSQFQYESAWDNETNSGYIYLISASYFINNLFERYKASSDKYLDYLTFYYLIELINFSLSFIKYGGKWRNICKYII